eukprot:jgi/Ulvmu1/9373/UM050_0125.1
MEYYQALDAVLLSLLASGVVMWSAATIGPTLRLCFTTSFADRLMLVRGQKAVIAVYVFNYSMLLVWGLSCVMVEVAAGSKSEFAAVFTATFGCVAGIACAAAHVTMAYPCWSENAQEVRSVEVSGEKLQQVTVHTVVARVAQLPDGSTALALVTDGADVESLNPIFGRGEVKRSAVPNKQPTPANATGCPTWPPQQNRNGTP